MNRSSREYTGLARAKGSQSSAGRGASGSHHPESVANVNSHEFDDSRIQISMAAWVGSRAEQRIQGKKRVQGLTD